MIFLNGPAQVRTAPYQRTVPRRFHSLTIHWGVIAAVLWLGCVASARGDEFRTWTDRTGAFKKTAAFVRLDGDLVFLRHPDGASSKIPLAKLSTPDQEYVKAASAALSALDPFETASDGPLSPRSDQPNADSNIRIVIVEGVGVDVASAKQDAYREAVRQVVGAFVDSTTMVRHDHVIEDDIITLSSAFVEKSEPLKETTQGDRLVRIRLRAHVRVNTLLDSLRSKRITTVNVDGESLEGQC